MLIEPLLLDPKEHWRPFPLYCFWYNCRRVWNFDGETEDMTPARCPVCDDIISIGISVKLSQAIICPTCLASLQVVALSPCRLWSLSSQNGTPICVHSNKVGPALRKIIRISPVARQRNHSPNSESPITRTSSTIIRWNAYCGINRKRAGCSIASNAAAALGGIKTFFSSPES